MGAGLDAGYTLSAIILFYCNLIEVFLFPSIHIYRERGKMKNMYHVWRGVGRDVMGIRKDGR